MVENNIYLENFCIVVMKQILQVEFYENGKYEL